MPSSMPHLCSRGGPRCLYSIDAATEESVYIVVGRQVMILCHLRTQNNMAALSWSKVG